MPWWQKRIATLEIDELKSLDMTEQVMREEERVRDGRSNVDNIILVVVIAFFVLLALRFYR